MTREMEKKRIEYIDLAKGFLIILVVLNHVNADFYSFHNNTVLCVLSTFRLPLYYVLSGFFISFKCGYGTFVEKKVNKLIIPFCFFIFLTNVYNFLLHRICGGSLPNHEVFVYNSPFYFAWTENRLMFGIQNITPWFLVSLFETYMLYMLLYKYCKAKIGYILPISLLISFVGFHVRLPFFLETSMLALPYVIIGRMIRQYDILERLNNRGWLQIVVAVLCLGIIAVFRPSYFSFVVNDYGSNSVMSVWLWGVIGSLGILLLAKTIGRIPVISYIGRYSIIVLGVHLIFYADLWYLINSRMSSNAATILVTVLLFGISFLSILMFKRFCPKLVAQADLIKFV